MGGGRRSPGVPRPAGGLAVEHPQLVVDTLVLGGDLLFLLSGQVTEHSVDGGHLRRERVVNVMRLAEVGGKGDEGRVELQAHAGLDR